MKHMPDELNVTPIDAELDQAEHEEALHQDEPLEIEDIIKNLKVTSRRDERVIAFFIVYAVDRFDYEVQIDDVLDQFKLGFDIDIPHDSFAVELAKGAVSEYLELDEQIKPHLKNWKLERLGCCTKLIIRLALWELSKKDTLPSIVINEAVELAKMFAEKDAYKFINGILDEICKSMGLTINKEKELI